MPALKAMYLVLVLNDARPSVNPYFENIIDALGVSETLTFTAYSDP